VGLPFAMAQAAGEIGVNDRWAMVEEQLKRFKGESILSSLRVDLRQDNRRTIDSLAVTNRTLPETVPEDKSGVAKMLAYEDDSAKSQKLLDHINMTLRVTASSPSPINQLSDFSNLLRTGESYLPYPFLFVSESKAKRIAANLIEAARSFTRKYPEGIRKKLYPLVMSSFAAILWDFIPIQTEFAARLAVQSWFNNVRSDVNNYKFACNMVNPRHSDIKFQTNDVISVEVIASSTTASEKVKSTKGGSPRPPEPVHVDNYILALLRFIRAVSACKTNIDFFSESRVFPAFISTVSLADFRDPGNKLSAAEKNEIAERRRNPHPAPGPPRVPVIPKVDQDEVTPAVIKPGVPPIVPIKNPAGPIPNPKPKANPDPPVVPGTKMEGPQIKTPLTPEPEPDPPVVPGTKKVPGVDPPVAEKKTEEQIKPPVPPPIVDHPPRKAKNTSVVPGTKKDEPQIKTPLTPEPELEPAQVVQVTNTDPVVDPPVAEEKPKEQIKPTVDDPHIMQEALRRQARLATSLIDLYYKLMSVGTIVADAGSRIILKSSLVDMVVLIISQHDALKRARKDTDHMIELTLSAIEKLSH
jgi:hypothetical protein